MNCEEARPLLSAFADGEFNGDSAGALASHVAGCTACGSEVEQFRALRTRLRSAVAAQPVALGLETRVRSLLREQRPAPWWQSAWPKFAGAAAAVVLLTAGVWITVWRPIEHQVLAALGIGASDHVHCTLERKSPPTGQLNRPIDPEYGDLLARVTKTMPADFQLMESHFCRWQGRRFQHIVFGHDSHKVSLIVVAKKDGEGFPQRTLLAKMHRDGIPLYSARVTNVETAGFESGRSLAFVVSDLDARQNLELLARLEPAIRDVM